MNLDLKTKSLLELKAIAYDIITSLEQYQLILGAVNKEIRERNEIEQKALPSKVLLKPVQKENPS